MPAQQYKKRIQEIMYFPLRGLTSQPSGIAAPDTMVEALNFLFEIDGVLKTRTGLRYKTSFIKTDNTTDYTTKAFSNISYVPAGNTIALNVFTKGKRIYSYDPDANTLEILTDGITEEIFSSATAYKDLAQLGPNVYFVDGTSSIYFWDGTSNVDSFTIPDASTYGNPVSITELQGRLYAVTDKGYLRYTGINTAQVWEERVLMGGTLAGTSGTKTIAGTDTTFTQVNVSESELLPQIGQQIFITDGTNSEYATIEAVGSNTAMTLLTNLVDTYTTANWYLIGADFQTPISPDADLKTKQVRTFANYLAISKTSDDIQNTISGMTYCRVTPIDNSLIMLVEQRELGKGYDIHPYSMLEYEDKLIFVASEGIYAIDGGVIFESQNITPQLLTQNKLEGELQDTNTQSKDNTRIYLMKNRVYNMICVSMTASNDTSNNKVIIGRLHEGKGFEFTKLQFTTGISDESTFELLVPSRDHAIMISKKHIFNLFEIDDPLFVDQAKEIEYPLASSTTFLASDVSASPRASFVGSTTVNSIIEKRLKSGTTSFNLLDKIKLSKCYIVTSELPSDPGFPNDYNVSLILDNKYQILNHNKALLGTKTSTIRADTSVYTADTTLITADVGLDLDLSGVESYPLFCPSKYVNNAAMLIEDSGSSGSIELRAYGLTVMQSKFV